jgi:hypothetical protein
MLHALVPRVVVGGIQFYPFFVGHGFTPRKKRLRIGSNRVT